MDVLLQKLTQQAMNYAIRSGIAITSGYAINQCSRLLKTVKSEEREELGRLQHRLDSKIRIIAPAIDMIELIAARGNTSLESAVNLTKSIRWDIQSLGVRLSKAAADEEATKRGGSKTKSSEEAQLEVKLIIKDIKRLLDRIEDAVPFINLAITTSGVNLSTNLPPTISPSRLLQASTFLSAGDSQYTACPDRPAQIGPRFTLSVYMLFLGHSNQAIDEDGFRNTIWKEVIHKAQMKLVRVPLGNVNGFAYANSGTDADNVSTAASDQKQEEDSISAEISSNEFAYQLTMIEDFDDDRVHSFEDDEERPSAVDDVASAGIRTFIPIHQISKIFYADTGKILNLGNEGESNNPILLLKRDPDAPAPRRLMERTAELDWDLLEESDHSTARTNDDKDGQNMEDNQSNTRTTNHWGLPSGLDPEWMALEVYNEGYDSDTESDTAVENSSVTSPPPEQKKSTLAAAFTNLRLSSHRKSEATLSLTEPDAVPSPLDRSFQPDPAPPALFAPITTSLSLLEMLVRLTSLQQFQQCSHLAITDELLNFFLSEGSTTGAASGDADARKRIRMEARQHVGFDPYDESPIKRRGEQYQANGNTFSEPETPHSNTQTSSPALTHPPSSSNPHSPLLLRSRHHSSMSPRHSPDPPFPNRRATHDATLPITPPGTDKGRRNILKNEAASVNASEKGRSSPLSRQTNALPSSSPSSPHS